MPYIEEDRRDFFNRQQAVNKLLDNMSSIHNIVKGDLTYLVYQLTVQYLAIKGQNYQNISDAKAALNDAADEIQDRFMRPREDASIKKNGDVLPKKFINP